MTDRELVALLQKQNSVLNTTLDSLSKTIEKQSLELAELKDIILDRDNSAKKLQQLAKINLPKKIEKRKPSNLSL